MPPENAHTPAGEDAIASGQYFRTALQWYDTRFHDPISERAFLVIITTLAVISIVIGTMAFNALFPLNPSRPFAIYVHKTEDHIYRIERIAGRWEDKNDALRRWFVTDYVKHREQYDADRLEFLMRRVGSLSSNAVYADYYSLMETSNPESPVVLFGRNAQRQVEILDYQILDEEKRDQAAVIFRSRVISAREIEPWETWRALLNFQFTDIVVDEKTGEKPPLEFIVTAYEVRPYRAE